MNGSMVEKSPAILAGEDAGREWVGKYATQDQVRRVRRARGVILRFDNQGQYQFAALIARAAIGKNYAGRDDMTEFWFPFVGYNTRRIGWGFAKGFIDAATA